MQMIARFLAVAEQRNAPVLERLAKETIRAVRIVGVVGAVDCGQPENCEGRIGLSGQHDFARAMHGAIEIKGRCRRLLGDERRCEGVDGVGTRVDELRDRDSARRLADRSRHGKISHQSAGVAALVRSECCQKHDRIFRTQPLGQPRARGVVCQIDIARSQSDRFDAGLRTGPYQSAPQKTARPKDDHALGFARLLVDMRQRHSACTSKGAPSTTCSRPAPMAAARSNIENGSITTRPRSRAAISPGLSARNCGQGVMMTSASAPSQTVSGSSLTVIRGCHSLDARTAGSNTRSRKLTSSLISATAGEFLIEWVFSLYVTPRMPMTGSSTRDTTLS